MFFRLEGAPLSFTVTLWLKKCEFVLAPTAITDGAFAGEPIELNVG